MAALQPGTHVRWTMSEALRGVAVQVLDAVLLRVTEKQVYLRARTPEGGMLFRWVHPKDVRETQDGQTQRRRAGVPADRTDRG